MYLSTLLKYYITCYNGIIISYIYYCLYMYTLKGYLIHNFYLYKLYIFFNNNLYNHLSITLYKNRT